MCIRDRSQQELDAYNAVTDCTVRDESGDITGMDIHPASYFLTSYYGNVRDLNFEEFLRYFPQDEMCIRDRRGGLRPACDAVPDGGQLLYL